MTTYLNGIELNSIVRDGVKSNEVDVEAGKLKVSGTAVTTTAAGLNLPTSIASSATSTVAVATETGDAIAVTLTLKNPAGTALAAVRDVTCWLSSSASTGAVASDDSITVTATTGSLITEHTDDLLFYAVTDATGVLVLSVAHAGNSTAKYLWVSFPGQAPLVSAAIDLA